MIHMSENKNIWVEKWKRMMFMKNPTFAWDNYDEMYPLEEKRRNDKYDTKNIFNPRL